MAESTVVPGPTLDRMPRWRFDASLGRRLVPAWLVALGLAQLVHGSAVPQLRTVVESLVYLALYWGLLGFAPVRRWVMGMPSPHRAVFAGFVFCLTVGQLSVKSRATFPFTAWTMYARPEYAERLDYYRYRGTDAAGREVAVDPADEWKFVNSAEIASRVKLIGRAAIAPADTPRRREARRKFRDFLQTLLRTYNQAHPQAPLRSLEVLHYAWDFRGGQASADVVPESLLRIEAEEAP